MKLAKYRLSTGQFGVGRVEADQLLPFDLSAGQYQSLFDILEADNPYEAAEFLTRADERIPLEELTLLPPIDRHASAFRSIPDGVSPRTTRPMPPEN